MSGLGPKTTHDADMHMCMHNAVRDTFRPLRYCACFVTVISGSRRLSNWGCRQALQPHGAAVASVHQIPTSVRRDAHTRTHPLSQDVASILRPERTWHSSLAHRSLPKRNIGACARLLGAPAPGAVRPQKSCWFCGEDCPRRSNQFFCQNCSYLQAPHGKDNFFELFNLEQKYTIDVGDLELRFRELQRQLHPDKHSTKGKEILEYAEQHSSRVNEGYGVLKCPLARAKYLLELMGHDVDEEGTNSSNSELLMEVLELQSQAESAATEDEVLRLREANGERRAKAVADLEDAFARGDVAAAAEFVHKLTYWNRIEALLSDKALHYV